MLKYCLYFWCVFSILHANAMDLNIAKRITDTHIQHKFVVVVCSYNNAKYYKKNLSSIFSQSYKNYEVVYVDDASTDNTYSLVKKFIQENHKNDVVSLVHNETNQKAGANLYRSINSIDPDKIAVVLDGDDWFSHEHVLEHLNQIYQDSDVWVTYGSFICSPSKQIVNGAQFSREDLTTGDFRKNDWRMCHLLTFYAGLAHKICLPDCLFKGSFLPAACDAMLEFPLIEMAREHVRCVPEITYVYNQGNNLNNFKIRCNTQCSMFRYLRTRPQYKTESSPFTKDIDHQQRYPVDIVVVEEGSSTLLKRTLLSIQKQVKGYDRVYVCVSKESSDLQKEFPHCSFIHREEFSSVIKDQYVAFCSGSKCITKPVDLQKGAAEILRRGALGFCYGKVKNPGIYLNFEKTLWARVFSAEDQEKWKHPMMGFCLYRPYVLQQEMPVSWDHVILSENLEGR